MKLLSVLVPIILNDNNAEPRNDIIILIVKTLLDKIKDIYSVLYAVTIIQEIVYKCI